ncbi:MAG TPA: sigma 54-interacting transcriptional regulator [Spirochaetota bacterium]|nr:sigma 54-interacting transcriptional regulator [Spirochaetota bacterium]
MTEDILDSISDGVFTVDFNWKITSFNKAAEKITGVKKTDALGKLCAEVFKSDMCENGCPLSKTLKNGKPLIDVHGFIVNPDGEKIPVSISTAILKSKSGKITGGAETFRDLREVELLRRELRGDSCEGFFSSSSGAMKNICGILPALAESSSTVLISGETGTGKEVLARKIHSSGPRKDKPFVAVNCGALPEELLESELFGYKKGAFTGADKDKPGRFAIAEGGTLFLDEIGEISQAMQVKLLRVLQEREYEPLGSVKSVKTDVRVIAATNRNLEEMIDSGKFRKDLYYRINVIKVELPPLRERKEDIPGLTARFIEKFNALQGKNISGISSEVFRVFFSHHWKGNIRELENVIERAFVLCTKKIIGTEHIPSEILSADTTTSFDFRSKKDSAEAEAVIFALKQNNYSRTKTASKLGIDKATLYRKMKKYGLLKKE